MPFSFSDGQFYSARGHLPPNRLDRCRLKNVLMSTGCRITNTSITNSVIGTRSIIGAPLRALPSPASSVPLPWHRCLRPAPAVRV